MILEGILNCPFCGKAPVTERTGFSLRAMHIYCINDNGCPRPKAVGETEEKAIENWNLRAEPCRGFAWLIEKGSGPDLSYYAPTEPGEWTKDHLKACRFARKQDAEVVQWRNVTHGRFPELDTRVCEHGWH